VLWQDTNVSEVHAASIIYIYIYGRKPFLQDLEILREQTSGTKSSATYSNEFTISEKNSKIKNEKMDESITSEERINVEFRKGVLMSSPSFLGDITEFSQVINKNILITTFVIFFATEGIQIKSVTPGIS
jgi:hypothetical protein